MEFYSNVFLLNLGNGNLADSKEFYQTLDKFRIQEAKICIKSE